MQQSAFSMAEAILQAWARGSPDAPDLHQIPPDLAQHAQQAAWIVAGQPARSSGWPALGTQSGQALVSIFQAISPTLDQQPPVSAWMAPAELKMQREVLFPRLQQPQNPNVVWQQLQATCQQLSHQSLPLAGRLEATLFALQRYAWGLRSPLTGVSRYDFARIHAAVAAALSVTPGAISLIGGDISGVQEFIYSVPAKGATKQLRGRSLYLQLLTDACANAILEAVQMPLCNLLYAGGGRFYLIAPATDADQVTRWRREIGQQLLAAHHGGLYLALGAVTLSPAQYKPETWQQLSEALEQDKRRRFATLGQAEFQRLFEPRPVTYTADQTSDEEPPDQMEQSLEDLGQQLSDAQVFMVERRRSRLDQPLHRTGYQYFEILNNLGLSVFLGEEPNHRKPTEYRRVLWLNDRARVESLPEKSVVGLRYTVTEARKIQPGEVHQLPADGDQPHRSGDVMPFNLLAQQSQGIKRIAVLRMDVDDLGELFGQRLERPTGIAALAHTAALSAALSRFFEGWVGQLCIQQNQSSDGGIYAVYSGGDDLFLVGSWHRMPDLAQQIRNDFVRYIHGKDLSEQQLPLITLSAGITLHQGTYPLYQAAEDAAEALDAAKQFQHRDSLAHRKDAISFLGRSLSWQAFANATTKHQQLVSMITQGAPKALLMVLQHLDQQARSRQRWNQHGLPQVSYGPWIWQGAYLFKRMQERASKETRPQIEELAELVLGSAGIQQRNIEWIGLAARWAQLSIRQR